MYTTLLASISDTLCVTKSSDLLRPVRFNHSAMASPVNLFDVFDVIEVFGKETIKKRENEKEGERVSGERVPGGRVPGGRVHGGRGSGNTAHFRTSRPRQCV